MTYQGARARPRESETGHFFAVSKVRLDSFGHVTHVLWNEVDARSNSDLSAAILVTVADVVDAIHDGAQVAAVCQDWLPHIPKRAFEIIAHLNGGETIALARPTGAHPTAQLNLQNMILPEESPRFVRSVNYRGQARVRHTFAVSKVRLDQDGRVTGVLWGKVDTKTNAWATPELVAPVADVVAALRAGDRVFALFPATNGHLPDRQFVVAEYDSDRQTIVLSGPSASDREIHDMDRLNASTRTVVAKPA